LDRAETALEASRVVAILRGLKREQTIRVGQALAAAGIALIEVTLNSPDALQCITTLATELANVVVGAGTVMTASEVAQSVDSGAEFIVSPHVDIEVIQATKKLGKVSVPGSMTPTEAVNAYRAGADVVKIFPASVVGTNFYREMKGPLPYIRLMATGGITLANAHDFIKAGAYSVALGSALTPKDLIAAGKYSEIAGEASVLMSRVKAALC